jgi:transcriptional regulator with XRE-family HTH domain
MTTADKLRAQRTKLGWTQAEVAERAKMSTVQYNGYETARHEPSEKTMARLARVLKVDPDTLWGDEWLDQDDQSTESLKDALRQRVAKDAGWRPERVRIIIQLD